MGYIRKITLVCYKNIAVHQYISLYPSGGDQLALSQLQLEGVLELFVMGHE